MKKKVLASLLAGVLSLGLLAGCGSNDAGSKDTEAQSESAAAQDESVDESEAGTEAEDGTEAGDESEETDGEAGESADAGDLEALVVGATPAPHAEILEAAKELLAAKGYDLQIVEFTDYVQPNEALAGGDLDANYFQHLPYLEEFAGERGLDLVSAASIHYEPYGIYAGKTATLEELEDGAKVAIPNDATNEARALLLLEAQGLITLKEGVGLDATVLDIEENEKNLDIVELEAAQIPHSLQDVDIAVINGNYALEAGLVISEDALATEDADSVGATTYGNVIAVREGEESEAGIQALVEVLQSDDIKNFIEEKYEGAVVPLY